MTVNFDDYSYYPALRSRLWEMKGYSHLSDDDKGLILPSITLTKYHNNAAVSDVVNVISRVVGGRPYIIDLESNPLIACEDAGAFFSPENDFMKWREFIGQHENAIPTVLLNAEAPSRSVVRQAMLLEVQRGRIVVRTRAPTRDLPVLLSIVSAVDSLDNLLIILDFGYIRSRLGAVAVEASRVIAALRDAAPEVRIVVMSTSYPRSASAYHDAEMTFEIEERQLHSLLGGDAVTIYGDHSSIHSEAYEPARSRFVPRIDYALPEAWIFRRSRAGYQTCAERIVELPDWDPGLLAAGVWGAQRIEAAKRGDLSAMGSPGPWIAVRVNLHIWQQSHNRAVADEGALEDLFD